MKQAVDDLDNSSISILGLFLRIPISKVKYPHSHMNHFSLPQPRQSNLHVNHCIQYRISESFWLCVSVRTLDTVRAYRFSTLGRERE